MKSVLVLCLAAAAASLATTPLTSNAPGCKDGTCSAPTKPDAPVRDTTAPGCKDGTCSAPTKPDAPVPVASPDETMCKRGTWKASDCVKGQKFMTRDVSCPTFRGTKAACDTMCGPVKRGPIPCNTGVVPPPSNDAPGIECKRGDWIDGKCEGKFQVQTREVSCPNSKMTEAACQKACGPTRREAECRDTTAPVGTPVAGDECETSPWKRVGCVNGVIQFARSVRCPATVGVAACAKKCGPSKKTGGKCDSPAPAGGSSDCTAGQWTKTGECSKECKQTWTREWIGMCLRPSETRTTTCRSGACAGVAPSDVSDCIVGDWNEGKCNNKCYRIDRRTIKQAPSGGGKRCPSIIRRVECEDCKPTGDAPVVRVEPGSWAGNLRLFLNLNEAKTLSVANVIDDMRKGALKGSTLVNVDGQKVAATGTTIKGEYGFLVATAAGKLEYTPNLSDPVVAILAKRARLTDTFELQVTDSAGLLHTTHVSITSSSKR